MSRIHEFLVYRAPLEFGDGDRVMTGRAESSDDCEVAALIRQESHADGYSELIV
jgi:hypothetical protein